MTDRQTETQNKSW